MQLKFGGLTYFVVLSRFGLWGHFEMLIVVLEIDSHYRKRSELNLSCLKWLLYFM